MNLSSATPLSVVSSRLTSLLGLALLAGCATLGQAPVAATPAPAPAQACAADTSCQGTLMAMPPTFEKVEDPAVVSTVLNAYVLGVPGKGGLCKGEVWRVKSPVTVYRLQNANGGTKLGYWWAFAPPEGTAADYRRNYVICPEWNSFTEIVVCQLKVGALVAVGPGQSATCKSAAGAESCLAASPSNQVNTDWQKNLENCVTGPFAFPASAAPQAAR